MFKVNSIFNWFSVGVVFGKTALLMLHFCTLKCSFVGIGYKKEEHAFEILHTKNVILEVISSSKDRYLSCLVDRMVRADHCKESASHRSWVQVWPGLRLSSNLLIVIT